MGEPEFTRAGYLRLLEALEAGGYAPRRFGDAAGEGERIVYLRHDVDKRPAAARRMAELEAEEGWTSSYFFLLRSPLYSVLEPTTLEDVRAIAEMGHAVGLHCDSRRMTPGESLPDFDARVAAERELFETVVGVPCTRAVSFHNPEDRVIGREPTTDAYVSTYGPRFMTPATKYLSESNARWREGNPLPEMREGAWPRLQLLVHPIWWDAPEPIDALEALRRVRDDRVSAVEDYLAWTNTLWKGAEAGEG